jgi:uncharacterized protein (TIGR02266 family)
MEHRTIRHAMPDLSRLRAPRVPFVRLLQVLPTSGGNTSRRLWAQNLSLGGAFIRTAEPLPVGTRVRVSFAGPDQKTVQVGEAKVCWRRSVGTVLEPTGFGVQFLNIEPPARALIQDLVQKALRPATGLKRPTAPAVDVEPPLRAPGWRPPLVPPKPAIPKHDAPAEANSDTEEGDADAKVLLFQPKRG